MKLFSLPVVVLLLFVLCLLFGSSVDVAVKANLYAIGLFLKDFITCILPFLIFSFVLSGLLNIHGGQLMGVFVLVALVCLSNFAGFWASYIFTAPLLTSGIVTISELPKATALEPAWHIDMFFHIKNNIALLCGVALGLVEITCHTGYIAKIGERLSRCASLVLKRMICPILPLFVLGFIIKMQHEGVLTLIIREYSLLLLVVALLAYGYMFTVMFFLSGRDIRESIRRFRNLLPGVLLGLFSMSSAAAIPSTIEGSEKNLKDKSLAKFVVSATANMHLLGDCFAIPIIGFAIMSSFGFPLPSPFQYLVFSLYGIIAKFAAAGIPGGSALVFLPIFEDLFGFSAPMLTALTGVYILFDPIATSSNVFGHGMFAILFEKVFEKIKRIIR
jgi:Na+/H+-dicarboxylate symporter